MFVNVFSLARVRKAFLELCFLRHVLPLDKDGGTCFHERVIVFARKCHATAQLCLTARARLRNDSSYLVALMRAYGQRAITNFQLVSSNCVVTEVLQVIQEEWSCQAKELFCRNRRRDWFCKCGRSSLEILYSACVSVVEHTRICHDSVGFFLWLSLSSSIDLLCGEFVIFLFCLCANEDYGRVFFREKQRATIKTSQTRKIVSPSLVLITIFLGHHHLFAKMLADFLILPFFSQTVSAVTDRVDSNLHSHLISLRWPFFQSTPQLALFNQVVI